MMPITGARSALKGILEKRSAFCKAVLAEAISENHKTILSAYSSGARDSASTPPARTSSERPARMLLMPESTACMPEAQLRITVQPGTCWPQPMRRSEEHTSELQSRLHLVCRLLLEKK